MSGITERLRGWAHDRGYAVAWGEVRAVEEALTELRARWGSEELDPGIHQRWLAPLDRLDRTVLAGARRVLVVSVPRPAHKLTFDVGGRPFETVVPPTYAWYHEIFETLRRELVGEVFGPEHRLDPVSAPLKSVACRLGLARYGRNNVTFVADFGSYHQLAAFLTDADLELPRGWSPQPPAALPDCDDCGVCLAVCPTGAIRQDRFLLRAETCFTFHSETPGPWRIPVHRGSHRCLIGCLDCQEACPRNAGLLRLEPLPVRFDAAETAAMLDETREGAEEVRRSIAAKLETIGMAHDAPVLGRNLAALLA